MSKIKLYSVTDWNTYALVTARSHYEAIVIAYRDRFFRVDSSKLTDDTVTHAMCCEYVGETALRLEHCKNDIYRVLVMNEQPETHHYQLKQQS
ncbi:conserved hypothetical protein [Vibrio crassostreae]|nr:conserved hypothetical protein [Vibrio crassostreae]CAK3907016.1 conserved hypothetical protein [Vibrio crassostreae]